jgi:hypothetical protein
MTTLEIILLITIVIGVAASLITINWFKQFNDDVIELWMRDKDAVRGLAKEGILDSIIDVEKFNNWFNSNKDPNVYAHPGIFLRLDKLSQGHIEDYIFAVTRGAVKYEDFDYELMRNFESHIRLDWILKIKNYA